MKKAFLFVGLFASVLTAMAQGYPSRLGKFKVDQIRGCAPFTVTILTTNLDGNGGCTMSSPCNMSFDGTSNCPPNPTCSNVTVFTYTTPGTYKLQVNYPSSTGPDDITITVDPDVQPPFENYSCAGSKVEVNITDKTYDTYYIDFNNDGVIDKTLNSGTNQTGIFTYPATGNYTIKVKGQKMNAANNCSPKVQPFTAITTLPIPTINSLVATDANTLDLAFTSNANVEYKSEIAINNATNFQIYGNLYGVNSLTVPNLNVDNNYYCLRLNSFDPCANTNNYTQPICSQKFSAVASNGLNQLSWQTSSLNIYTIQVKRDNNAIASLGSTATSYPDKNVVCKTTYQYQLVSTYTSGATSTSLSKTVTAFSSTTPTAINNTSATVDGSQVDLKWIQDPAFTTTTYDILRAPKGGSFIFLGNSTTTDYIDKTYNNSGYCYQINYIDNCDNASAKGLPACPMVLSASLGPANEVTLNWSAYKGWNKGVKNYKVLRYYQPLQTPQTIYVGSDSTYLDDQPDLVNQIVYYRIIATANEAGIANSSSNEIKVVRRVNLYYPTAFNPESKVEPVNRTFAVKGHFISTMKLEVFDRWGALVFYSDKNEPWDGKREGIAMPDATYVWTAEGTDLAGNSFRNAGTVVLIRK